RAVVNHILAEGANEHFRRWLGRIELLYTVETGVADENMAVGLIYRDAGRRGELSAGSWADAGNAGLACRSVGAYLEDVGAEVPRGHLPGLNHVEAPSTNEVAIGIELLHPV